MSSRDLAAEELEQAAYDYWWPILAKDEEMNAIDYNNPEAAREALRKLLAENAKLRAVVDAMLLEDCLTDVVSNLRAAWPSAAFGSRTYDALADALEALEEPCADVLWRYMTETRGTYVVPVVDDD